MSAQFAEGLFPDLCVIGCGLEVQRVEREAARFQARAVAGDAVGVQHRAMLIRRGDGGSLPYSSGLEKRQRGDQNQQSTRKNETLHMSEPVARSTSCNRMFTTVTTPVLSQMLPGGYPLRIAALTPRRRDRNIRSWDRSRKPIAT